MLTTPTSCIFDSFGDFYPVLGVALRVDGHKPGFVVEKQGDDPRSGDACPLRGVVGIFYTVTWCQTKELSQSQSSPTNRSTTGTHDGVACKFSP